MAEEHGRKDDAQTIVESLAGPPRYEDDFYAWTQKQALLLREGKWSALDIENLAEEIEDLATRQENELESRLMRLMQHLLKWQYQTQRRGRSWRGTIVEQRSRIRKRLSRNPSLRRLVPTMLVEEYRLARLKASGETRLPEETFPSTCPWTVEQLLDEEFWPGEPLAKREA
jgi:hypothetical protein